MSGAFFIWGEATIERSRRWLRHRLLDVLKYACVASSLPPCDHLNSDFATIGLLAF
jgi:hypothetical protein